MSTTTKVVIVTGVSSGIGKVTAEKFVERGCVVFGTVRNVGKAEHIRGVELVEMDVGNEESVKRAVQSVIARAGRIDVLVNNAGVSLLGSVEESTIKEAEDLFDTNFFGVLRTMQAVLPQMRTQGSGRIVNVSSVLGLLPAPYMGIYAASKHAVEGISETLDHEVRRFGIRVTLVEPAYTRTNLDINAPRTRERISAYSAERDQVERKIAANVNGAPEPDSVAETILTAALGKWRIRRAVSGQAAMLSFLRRFMPAAPVDAGIRKDFGLN
ncbi:MAG TPA: oxidoreductase [Fluviicoccus sp.]|nr:oxidoreductase [Fluviicoccus sp.]